MSEEIINVPAPLGRAKALSAFLFFGGGADFGVLFYLCFNVCNSMYVFIYIYTVSRVWYGIPWRWLWLWWR